MLIKRNFFTTQLKSTKNALKFFFCSLYRFHNSLISQQKHIKLKDESLKTLYVFIYDRVLCICRIDLSRKPANAGGV